MITKSIIVSCNVHEEYTTIMNWLENNCERIVIQDKYITNNFQDFEFEIIFYNDSDKNYFQLVFDRYIVV